MWLFAFLTAGGTAIAVVQLVVDPQRDLLSFVYGVIVGAVAAACVASLVVKRREGEVPSPSLTQAQAVDRALVTLADLKAQQAHAQAQQAASEARAREARNAGADVDAAKYQGDANQYKVHYDALFDRIRTAEIEAGRIRRMPADAWPKESKRT